EQIFQGLLGRVDQVMETRFTQTHCRNLEIGCVTGKPGKIRALAAECKGLAVAFTGLFAGKPAPTRVRPLLWERGYPRRGR
ncbi:hypothetical protein SCB29_35365, partial [Paraburkholderia sp. SIMBA_055]